ncbi:cytochrome b561 [Afipia massiliensis]|uniref:Cytochrome b561 n=1 Tax=Afipia massiliensis TaxID=211460 RepID=A0A840N8Q6_9BRAD|nr:cytochrome b561 [Afipia massiliensis]
MRRSWGGFNRIVLAHVAAALWDHFYRCDKVLLR